MLQWFEAHSIWLALLPLVGLVWLWFSDRRLYREIKEKHREPDHD
jgi:hypothetical protein